MSFLFYSSLYLIHPKVDPSTDETQTLISNLVHFKSFEHFFFLIFSRQAPMLLKPIKILCTLHIFLQSHKSHNGLSKMDYYSEGH